MDSSLFPTLLLAVAFGAAPAHAMSKKQAAPGTEPAASTAAAAKSPTNGDSVWVGKSDKAISCAKQRGIDVDDMAKELIGGQVQVLAKKKLHDSKMRIQMCGVDKGDMNGYLISKKDLDKAKELGFSPVNGTP